MLDEKGWIFLDDNHRPFLCALWGERAWLFYWHTEGHWVSLRPVTQMEIWTFPRNLTEIQQQLYRDEHDRWNAQTMLPEDKSDGD
jgi:hypothetical protein